MDAADMAAPLRTRIKPRTHATVNIIRSLI